VCLKSAGHMSTKTSKGACFDWASAVSVNKPLSDINWLSEWMNKDKNSNNINIVNKNGACIWTLQPIYQRWRLETLLKLNERENQIQCLTLVLHSVSLFHWLTLCLYLSLLLPHFLLQTENENDNKCHKPN